MLPSSPRLGLLPLLLLGACAHSPAPTSSVAKEPPAMTESARDARGRIINPRYTPEELGLRLMRLFDSAYHADELTPERVFEMTGVRMEEDPPGITVSYSAIGDMTDDWRYWFVLSNQPSTGNKLRVEIRNKRKEENAPLTPVCSFDLEQYKTHLEQLGFKGSQADRRHWFFHRGQLAIRLYFTGESSEQIDHKCVYMVIVDSPVESARSRRRRNAD
jgi:hypothetical protein